LITHRWRLLVAFPQILPIIHPVIDFLLIPTDGTTGKRDRSRKPPFGHFNIDCGSTKTDNIHDFFKSQDSICRHIGALNVTVLDRKCD
ncbi:hypothetical protein BOV92_13610, partial [Solemya velum gill symbiont]